MTACPVRVFDEPEVGMTKLSRVPADLEIATIINARTRGGGNAGQQKQGRVTGTLSLGVG